MAHHRPVRLLAAFLSVLLSALPAWPHDDAVPPLAERFLGRVETPLTSYRSTRRLHARNERFGAEGWLEAEVLLEPGVGLTYQVLREGGSAYVRNRVLRKALQAEQELIAGGRVRQASFTLENYRFAEADVPPTGDGLAFVLLRPLRRDPLLVDGLMALDDEADLVRVEGRLSKNPSFWTTGVRVIRRYGRVGGVRVPLWLETTASVRIAGASRMRIDYAYEDVNGQPVGEPAAGEPSGHP
jgi:hypothetical protein